MDKGNFKQKKNIGILICGHGSRNKLAIDEFEDLTLSVKNRYAGIHVEYGFLEFAKPSLNEALDKLKAKDIKKVIAIPAMLFAAGHVKNDIPSVLNSYAKKANIEITYGRELGINNLMISAACERVKEVFISNPKIKPSDSVLVVVGRGSSDPDANSNVSKITRMLVEGLGMGWGETVYSGVTFPLVGPGLNHIVRLGYKNVILFPYFLFSGVLVTRIKRQREAVALNNPDVSFYDAKYLSSHPYVIDTFVERINEVISEEDNAVMNCSLCKYRSNLFGFEQEVGLTQASHHDHVEGLGLSCNLCESECNGACELDILTSTDNSLNTSTKHDHSLKENIEHHHHHHHETYPNAQHPLGPVSLKYQEENKS